MLKDGLMEKVLTVEQAFKAMFLFLENEYLMTKEDAIGSLLGDLSLDVWGDGTTGDPASWGLWLEAVEKALKDEHQLIH